MKGRNKMKEFIYADNAATTRISDGVLNAMLPYMKEEYGNASSIYYLGRNAHHALEDARKRVSDILGAGPMDIYFTSGGSEADNWALKGILGKLKLKGKTHLITTSIEHHAILHSAKSLEREGFDVTYLPVDEFGRVEIKDIKNAIREDTALISVMYANNEVGTIQPIKEIGKICREAGILFHTDAVQAVGTLPINVKDENIDMLSLSAHKFHGPKGIGVLYCKRNIYPNNLIDGGAQERGHRAGTENVALAIGLAAALEEASIEREEKYSYIKAMRDKLQEGLMEISDVKINGDPENRLPGNLSLSFEGLDGESLLFALDLKGVAASSGSACSSGSLDPSHVLLAMGLPYGMAHGSLRLTLGKYNTYDEVDQLIKIVKETVAELKK